MKFYDRNNNKELELQEIIGSDYWENSSGEIYAIDSTRGYAWPVRPSHALKSVLERSGLRQSDEKVVRVQCCREINPEASRGHTENYLKAYKSFIRGEIKVDKITE